MDTSQYEVQLEDGTTEVYLANTITANLWAQCDAEGVEHIVIDEIVGHRKLENALSKDDEGAFTTAGNGNRMPARTTKGWEINFGAKTGKPSGFLSET